MIKIIVKISGLYLLLCCSVITAQDLQKWYADDLYYNSNEKETNIIEIVEYSEYNDFEIGEKEVVDAFHI